MVFVEGAVIPSVADDSVLRGQGAGQVGRLSRAGKSRHDGLDQKRLSGGFCGKVPKAGRVFAQMSVAQADYVENCRPRAIATLAFDHRLRFKKGLAPSLQVLHRLENFFLVHRVNFNPFPDALNESDGEFATEVSRNSSKPSRMDRFPDSPSV